MSRVRNALVAAMTVALAVAPIHAAVASVPAEDLGAVTVVDGSGRPLSEASSADRFGVQLPADAICPGDSANDQWRVQSFFVPVTSDPGAIVYGPVGPVEDEEFPLYTPDGNYYTNMLTLPNPVTGTEGIIGGIPRFTFENFPKNLVAPGRYKMGIACTLFGATGPYWDTEADVVVSATDPAAGFVWAVIGDTDSAESADSSGFALAAIVAGTIVAGAAILVAFVSVRRRSRRTPSPSTRNRFT